MRFTGFIILAFALKYSAVPLVAQGVDSATERLDRVQGLLYQAHVELDSLKKEMTARTRVPVSNEAEKPILTELLTEQQKVLLRASGTLQRRTAVGYSFNPNLGMGMDFINWIDDWGGKLDAGLRITRDVRQAGFNASLLRSLNRFTMIDAGLETHLYAFTGLGATWEKIRGWSYSSYSSSGVPLPDWYEKPDLVGRWQLGAGVEMSLLGFGGIKFVPEVGLQVSKYLSRFQDSPSWQAANLYPIDLPKSDYSLDPYYAFHLNFYFR